MPRGFSGLRDAAAEKQARRAAAMAAGGSGKRFFSLKDGETATVRFLEQGDEVCWAYAHKTPATGERRYGDFVVCRDQDEDGRRIGADCPGCEKGYKRTERGAINLIWRNAPVFKKDAEGNYVKENGNYVVDGYADQVAVWNSGPRVFDNLDFVDGTYRGLSSRDFNVSRSGTELNTEYKISPTDVDGGPQPMSAEDEKLAEDKFDLTEFTVPQDYDSWGKKPGYAEKLQDTPQPEKTSPFMRKR